MLHDKSIVFDHICTFMSSVNVSSDRESMLNDTWDFGEDNLFETCSIVGRDCGLVSMHCIAVKITVSTLLTIRVDGSERRRSRTSFTNMFVSCVEDDDDKSLMKSPGCIPCITSIATTPKLYTSHFLVTFIVYASSVNEQERKHVCVMSKWNKNDAI